MTTEQHLPQSDSLESSPRSMEITQQHSISSPGNADNSLKRKIDDAEKVIILLIKPSLY